MATSRFDTEYTRLQKYLGDSSTNTLVYLKQMINDAYLELLEAYDWPWMFYTGTVELEADYSTGTLTVTDDSQSVTGSGTSWDTGWSGFRIRTAGGEVYGVSSFDSTTAATLDRNAVVTESGVAYTAYKDVYALGARLRSLVAAYPTKSPSYPVRIIGPDEMATLKRDQALVRDPIECISFVDTDSTNLVSQIEVYPIPDAATTLWYKGYRQAATLSNDADGFIFPAALLPTFRHLALSLAWDWRGRTEFSMRERNAYEVALDRAITRTAPDADAGTKVRLDEQWFYSERDRDERPRAGWC